MGRMLRFGIPVLLIFSLMCVLAGCGGGTWHDEEMRHGTDYTTEKANGMYEKIIACINDKDPGGLSDLFSEKSHFYNEELGDQAEALIDKFDGKKITDVEESEPGFSGADYAQPLQVFDRREITLDSGEIYSMDISFYDIFDDHPDYLGLELLKVRNCTMDDTLEGYDWDKEKDADDGIYFYEK